MRETGESVRYFARLVFLISCILALFPIIAGIGLMTWKQDKVAAIRTQIVEAFPRDLAVQVKNGEVSTNANEPYAVPQPAALRDMMMRWMKTDTKIPYDANNLLVINTQKPIELTDFRNYGTLAILSKNEIGVFSPTKGSIEIQSLRDVSLERPLDRQSFGSFIDSGWEVAKTVMIVLLILSPFIIFVAIFILHLIYLIFGALVVWLASSIVRRRSSYGQAYQEGLHLMTLPLIASFVLPFIFALPFAFTLLLFIMALLNFRRPETLLPPGTSYDSV